MRSSLLHAQVAMYWCQHACARHAAGGYKHDRSLFILLRPSWAVDLHCGSTQHAAHPHAHSITSVPQSISNPFLILLQSVTVLLHTWGGHLECEAHKQRVFHASLHAHA